jgi:hypothetical protein
MRTLDAFSVGMKHVFKLERLRVTFNISLGGHFGFWGGE